MLNLKKGMIIMKKLFKKISAVVIALAVVLTTVMFGVPEKIAAADTGECEHDYRGYGSPMDPTCTQRGVKRYFVHCMNCNRYFANDSSYGDEWRKDPKEITEDDVYIPALGHDFTGNWGGDYTHHWHICTRKGCNATDEKIAHSGGTATCQAKAVCEVCGVGYGEKGDHIYNTEWSTSDYSHWHTCTLCGTKKDTGSHSGGTATCTKRKVCEICGQEYGGYAAHNYSDYENNDTQHWQVCLNPDCGNIKNLADHNFVWKKDETGHWHECSVCHLKKDDKESHNIVLWEGREPTCKLIGFTDGLRCSECYYVEKARERIDKTDHTWGEWIVTTPATEETDGEKTHTCSVCNTTETAAISATGHTFSDDWTSDSTHHWHAATCAHPDVVDGKAPHTWSDWTVKTPATETNKGEETRKCTVCKATESREISVLEHVHTFTKHNKVEPDCTTTGNIEYWTCSGCNKSFSDENGTTEVTDTALPAKGHTIVTDAAIAPTCTAAGKTEGSHCSVCNTVITAQTTVAAKGHTWGAWTVKTPVTETDKGEETRECSVCKATESRDIPALNHKHTLVHVPETPATETTEGVREHWHCDGCGKDFFDEDGTKEANADDLKIGKIETEVQASASVPKPEIATPKEELIEAALSEDEQKKVGEGAYIKIILKVEDATQKVPDKDKTSVIGEIANMTNYKLGQYLDITLLKKIGELEQMITNTSAPIKITFEIPERLRGKTQYSVIRVHGSETTVLHDLDNEPNTVTIETDKFSTYALAYREKTTSSRPNSGGSRPYRPSTSNTSDDTSSDTSDDTSSNTSDNTSSDFSDDTSSGTSDDTSYTSSDISNNNSSDTSDTSNDTSSSAPETSDNSSEVISGIDENSHVPSESSPSNNNDNPSTGIAVSLIPFAAILSGVIVVINRKKR